MYIFLLVLILILIVSIRLRIIYSEQIKFFITGLDNSFKFSEVIILWRLAKICKLDEPIALFWSVPVLNKSIRSMITESRRNGTESSTRIQTLLTKLYKYRTKIDLDSEGKRGLDSTKYLDKGQRLRIILPGHGVFSSEILNNGHEIIIRMPVQNNIIKLEGSEWISRTINVYLWRKGDASYVFDTKVLNAGIFNSYAVLYLAQTDKLLRAQKRRSVRCQCSLYAQLYFLKSEVVDYNVVETAPGYRCLLEDISEDGALIRVGGKGQTDIQIKLQFKIEKTLILMYGIIRAVEYNKEINQSRLHFECIHLEKEMRNEILSFVYNVLPDDQKEIFEALSQTEADEINDTNTNDTIAAAAEDIIGKAITQKQAEGVTIPDVQASSEDIEKFSESPVQDKTQQNNVEDKKVKQ